MDEQYLYVYVGVVTYAELCGLCGYMPDAFPGPSPKRQKDDYPFRHGTISFKS